MVFNFPAGKSFDYLRDEQGRLVGAIVRQWNTLNGSRRNSIAKQPR